MKHSNTPFMEILQLIRIPCIIIMCNCFVNVAFGQASQFPQAYYNGQGSGGVEPTLAQPAERTMEESAVILGSISKMDSKWEQGGILEGKSPDQEMLDKRTELSKKFDNGDGTTDVIIGGPFHYMDESGAWQDIDHSIQEQGDPVFKFVNRANRFVSRFGAHPKDGVEMEHDGRIVAFGVNPSVTSGSWTPQAATVTPLVLLERGTIVYKNVFQDVDLEYEINSERVQHRMTFNQSGVFSELPASQQYVEVSEEIRLPSGALMSDEDGAITSSRRISGNITVSLHDEILYTILESRAWDAGFNGDIYEAPSDAEGFTMVETHVAISAEGEIMLIAKLPVAWLLSPSRVYPVVLDPDVYVGGVSNPTLYYRYPFNTCRTQRVSQILFKRSDIGTSGAISSIAFYRGNSSGASASNVTIKMQSVNWNPAAFTSCTHTTSGWSTMASSQTINTSSGWKNISLSSYNYSNTQDLLIETRFNNSSASTGCSCTSFATPGGGWGYVSASYYGHRWAYSNTSASPPTTCIASPNDCPVEEQNSGYGNIIPSVKITIGSSCTNWYASPSSANLSASSSCGNSFNVYATGSGCSYSVLSDNAWINNLAFSGGGATTYCVDVNNTGGTRTGTISIRDGSTNATVATFTVVQAGAPCTPPSVTANSNSPITATTTLNLTATTISGATYSWTGPSGYTSTSQNPTRTNATTSMSGNYCVTATVNGCTSSQSCTPVTVNSSIPGTPATPSNPGTGCGSVVLSWNGTPPTGDTWYWQGTSCGTSMSNSNSTYTAPATGTYYIRAYKAATATWSTGCGQATITVAQIPSAPMNVIATATGTSTIDLTWNPSANAASYDVYTCTGTTPIATNVTSPYAINGLTSSTTYSYRVKACNSCGCSAAYSTCGSATTIAPPPPLVISGLQVFANSIPAGSPTRTASGNVSVAPVGCSTQNLRFGGNVTGNTSLNTISGNCPIYLNSVQGHSGTFSLYNGPFQFQVSGTTMQGSLNNLINNHLYKMANLGLQYDDVNVSCGGVLINGTLKFPSWLKSITLNGPINCDASINQLSITQQNGVQYSGQVSLSGLKFRNVLEINQLSLSFNTITDEFTGNVGFTTPLIKFPFNTFAASATVRQAKLNALSLNLSGGSGIPIGATGLKFTTVYGGFDQLNSNNSLEINAGGDIQPAIPADLTAVSNLNLDFTYVHGTSFIGSGTMSLFNQSLAGLNTTFFVHKAQFNAYLNILSIVKGQASFGIKKELGQATKMLGTSELGLHVPSSQYLPNIVQIGLNAFGLSQGDNIAYANSYLNNTLLAGKVSLNSSILPKLYYSLTWSGGSLTPKFGTNYQNVIQFADAIAFVVNGNQPQFFTTVTSGLKSFSIEHSSDNILIEAKSNGINAPELILYRPDGDTVTAANIGSYSDVSLGNDDGYTVFALRNAMVGDYLVEIINADSLQIRRSNMSPFGVITSVIQDDQNKTLTITWKDSDPDDNATVTIGYDTDEGNGDGLTIFTTDENDPTDSYVWDYSAVMTGNYQLYILVSDSSGQANLSYYDGDFELISNNEPNPPTNLQVAFNDTTIHLEFQGSNPFMNSYIVYYSNKPNTVDYASPSLAIGDTLACDLSNLIPGGYYEFMVTSLDTLLRQSRKSNIVGGVWQSSSFNNVPHFDVAPDTVLFFEAGQSSNFTFSATDLDGDDLSYSILLGPAGGAINSASGTYTWNPDQSMKGAHRMVLQVTDGNSGEDTVQIILRVMDANNAYADADFNKVMYMNYDDVGVAYVSDPEFIGRLSAKDSLQVRIYSDTDPVGIEMWLFETSNRSPEFMNEFLFTPSSSFDNSIQVMPGDTIWIDYFDESRAVTNTDYAYFIEYQARFEAPDTICSGDTIAFLNTSYYSNSYFAWNLGDGNSSTDKHPEHAYPATTGFNQNGELVDEYIVQLTVYDDEGRSSTTSKTIVVVRQPESGLLPSYSACGNYLLEASIESESFSWSSGDTTESIMVTESSEFVLTLDNHGHCNRQIETYVEILEAPEVSIISEDTMLCSGQSIELWAMGGMSYDWSVGGQQLGTSDTVTVALAVPGTSSITVDVIGTDGVCEDTASITIQVVDSPLVSVESGDTQLCFGDSVLISASGADQYSWQSAGAFFEQSPNQIWAKPLISATYTVIGTDESGCEGIDSLMIEMTQNPTVPNIALNGGTLLCLTPAPSYQWFLDGDLIPNAIFQSYTPIADGNYTVVITNDIGCFSAPSASYPYFTVGISDNMVVDFTVLPNPSHGNFDIVFPDLQGQCNYEIFSSIGQLVQSGVITSERTAIQLQGAAAGIYSLRVVDERWQMMVVKRVVLQ